MFLTKKGFWKAVIVALCYCALGCFCFLLAILLNALNADAKGLLVLGIVCCALSPLLFFWGRYAEGKGKLINTGNKLIRQEFRPAEFIKQYKDLLNSSDLVVKKPSVEILELVAVAYHCLDDRENCLATVDEMVSIASEKQRALTKLIKISYLYSYGMTEEAEQLYSEIRKLKLNAICTLVADNILKGDRAKAMGDYKTVEAHCLKKLEQTFPKLDDLGKLILHFELGEVYEKMQDREKAILNYKYCADLGGETAIKTNAVSALQRLQ